MAFYSSNCHIFNIFIITILVSMLAMMGSSQLTSNCYQSTCPRALSIIRSAVINAVAKEHRMGASLLRLHFHDCFVNGCDASVLLDDSESLTGEKSAGANVNSLRGFDVIDDIKTQLEAACPSVVSCADILALAARDAVVALGGPSWNVELGRRDSTTASKDAATKDIPSPLMNLDNLISAFANKGFDQKEMVALSGAHTIGQARCQIFRGRLYNETSSIESSFDSSVKSNCPINGGDSNLSPLDVTTSVLFDNAYFKNLVNKKGLLHSDQQLFSGGSTDSLVTAYGNSPASFYVDFASAMVKMGNLSPLTGKNGEIRSNCHRVN